MKHVCEQRRGCGSDSRLIGVVDVVIAAVEDVEKISGDIPPLA
jgi:hypothetical protein